MCDAIHQAGLLCDILFVDSAIIVLEKHLLHLHGTGFGNLFRRERLARFQLGGTV